MQEILAFVSSAGHIESMVFRLARLVLGIPLSVLAEHAGISSKELGRIERGEVHPRRETLAALNDAFAAVVTARLGANEEKVSS